MKTIEEKAKAYDKVRKKIAIRFGSNVADEFFAEFEESEDEKIRKGIIELVKQSSEILNKKNQERMLSWLERQGEHANFRNKIQVGDKVTRNENGVLVNLSQLKRVAKPVDKIEPKFKVGDKIYLKPEYRMPNDDTPIANTVKEIRRIDDKHYRFDGSYIFIEDQDKYELVEQKPKENKGNIGGISSNWSEEDGMILSLIVNSLKFIRDTLSHDDKYTVDVGSFEGQIEWLQSLQGRVQPKQEWSEEDEEILRTILSDGIRGAELDMLQVNWLKSLKDRVQPKQEWNEEDEQHIDSLLKRLDALCRNKFERTRFAISEDRDWLKSLRHQSRWKPSELQLECLSDAIEYYNSFGYPAPKLKELLDDLKKLKEGKV